jgi:hypothetical protein
MAAAAGHDLTIEVGQWQATIDNGSGWDGASLALTAEPSSFKVTEGAGGAKPLSDKDRGDILKNINEKILKGKSVTFRSTQVTENGGTINVGGDLDLVGASNPVHFSLTQNGDKLAGSAQITQTKWGIKPFSALMGALKVADVVTVELEASVPAA